MVKEQDVAKKEFVSEAEEILERLSSDIMDFENSYKSENIKPALVNKLFREIHSLKGLAGMLGFQQISDLSHHLESLLDKLRMGKISVGDSLISLLFESLDVLLKLVARINTGKDDILDITGLMEKVTKIAEGELKDEEEISLSMLSLDEKTIKSFTEYEEHRLLENIRSNNNIISLNVGFSFEVFDTELKNVTELLTEHGELISTLPWTGEESSDKIHFKLLCGTQLSEEELKPLITVDGLETETIYKATEKDVAPSVPLLKTDDIHATDDSTIEEDLKSISQTIRVDIEKLDKVMNIVGELVISKSAIEQIGKELAGSSEFSDLGMELGKAVRHLDRKLNDLQQSVIDVRMVPIGQIYNKLSRAARKIMGKTDKQLELRFIGGDTELDKVMIEEITNPLLHIIRNSIDHGIEPPEIRKKAGKPEKGLITLSAYQKGNSVVIDVTDDGKGIDTSAITASAIKKGLIKDGTVLSQEESINLMFTPGFSSAEKVSDISGRGVGLDVVKSNISDLKGTINIESEAGKGTTFQITLPITLAIIQILVVLSGNRKFCIPLSSVAESLRIKGEQIQTVDRKEVYYFRDLTLPLVRLNDFFNLERAGENKDKIYIVVVQAAEKKIGLVVDRLMGQQEVVIKSIGTALSNLPGIAGACELGENQAVLVLDIGSLLEKVTTGKNTVTEKQETNNV